MSIEIILTNHPIRAAEALSIDLRDHQPSEAFVPQLVFLTDPSIETWLRTWLAHHTGIAANLELTPLREGLLAAWSTEDCPLTEPEPAVLAAAVVRAWGDLSDARWAPVREALERGEAVDRGARKLALAFQVAQWILESFWDGSEADEGSWLRATRAGVEDPRRRTASSSPAASPTQPVRVFASRALTGRERGLIEALGAGTDVRIYRSVADPARWEAGEAFPPGSSAARLLTAEEAELVESRKTMDMTVWRESIWSWDRPTAASLERWQCALRTPETCGRETVPAGAAFIPAWSPRREVEILRDRLLRRFSATDATRLEPRDVLVLTPDLTTYGPLIASIFSAQAEPMVVWGPTEDDLPEALASPPPISHEPGQQPSQPVHTPVIPTRLVGLGLSQTNPVARALLDLLRVCADRVTAPALHTLATMPVVRRRFGIPEGSDGELFELLRESNAAWGLDGADKAEVYGQASHSNSLGFGLERLALSAFVHHEADAAVTSVKLGERRLAPLAAASREREHLSGAIGRLIGSLRETRAELRALSPGTGRQWRSLLGALTTRFTSTGATTAWLTRSVLEAIEACVPDNDDLSLDLEGVRRLLRGRFELPVSVKGDFGGVVLVKDLGPGAIPARPVLVFLGMNTGAYPRRARYPEWRPPPKGPNAVDRQRQAFADALLSAGSELWVTWTARELKKGQEQPPSSLVQELEDLLCCSKEDRKKWREPQGRHAWSERAEAGFSAALAAARAQVVGAEDAALPPHTLGQQVLPPAKIADDGRARSLEIEALVRALVNPSKTYLYGRLGVYLPEDREELPEREPLDASGLSSYGLRVEALAALGNEGRQCARWTERALLAPVALLKAEDTLAKARGELEDHAAKETKSACLGEGDQSKRVACEKRLSAAPSKREAKAAEFERLKSKYPPGDPRVSKAEEALAKLQEAVQKDEQTLADLETKEQEKRDKWEAKLGTLQTRVDRAQDAVQALRCLRDEVDALLPTLPYTLDEHSSQVHAEILDHHAGTGDVPLHVAGEQAVAGAVERVTRTLGNLGRANGEVQRDVLLSLELRVGEEVPVTLTATIPEVYSLGDGDERRCLHQWMMLGSSGQKPYLRAWIGLWLARATGEPVCAARIVSASESEWLVASESPDKSEDPGAARAQAVTVLQGLLEIRDAALRRPLPLFERSSLALATELHGKEPKDGTELPSEALAKLRVKAARAVAGEWFLSLWNHFPDELDRWIATVHPGLDPSQVVSQHPGLLDPLAGLPAPHRAEAGFVELSRRLWAELLAHKLTDARARGHRVAGHPLAEWVLS